MKILKYPVDSPGRNAVFMPHGAKILTVQVQHDRAQVWALCNEQFANDPRYIVMRATGEPLTRDPGQYIATVQMKDGTVWHAFEEAPW